MSEEEEVEVMGGTGGGTTTEVSQSPMYRGPDADLQSADVSELAITTDLALICIRK